jgi:DNA-binding IclR family transcriptional regulator
MVRCLAAPVRGKDGEVIGAVGITATTMTFSEDRIPMIADKVLSFAAMLSNEMGNARQKDY